MRAIRLTKMLTIGLLAFTALPALPTNAAPPPHAKGWWTVVGPGQKEYFDTAYAACARQKEVYAPRSGFTGVTLQFPTGYCQWNWVFLDSLPATVFFECEDGYIPVSPGMCVADPLKNRPPDQCGPSTTQGVFSGGAGNNPVIGNPIELVSGRKLETTTDFSTSDELLHVTRRYSSIGLPSSVAPSGVNRFGGAGWSFDFGPVLRLYSGFGGYQMLTLTLPDASSYEFDRVGTNFVPKGPGATDKLTDSRFTVTLVGPAPTNWSVINTQPSEWIVTDRQDGSIYSITTRLLPDTSTYTVGYPTEIKRGSGYKWDLTYGADAELIGIRDSFNRALSFEYFSGSGATTTNQHPTLIKSISLPNGEKITYGYKSTSQFSPTPSYAYTDVISSVVRSANGAGGPVSSTSYHYEDSRFPHLLTGITDERGVRFATWAYDDQGRAISSKHGVAADSWQIAYDNSLSSEWKRTVTNPLGKNSVYKFSRSGDYWLLKSVDGEPTPNCPASNSSYQYTGRLLTRHVDEEGRVAEYQRNADGLITTLNEAVGLPEQRTTTFVWRSDLQLSEMTAPGLHTQMTYDAGGRLSGVSETDITTHTSPYVTAGQVRQWTYGYTANGLLEFVDGPLPGATDKTSYAYDGSGYLKTVTNELGQTTTVTSVDSSGRPLSLADANAVVTNLTYSAEGYVSSITVDPSGVNSVTTLTHNALGQVTNVSRPDGGNLTYTYDAARYLSTVTDAAGNVLRYVRDGFGNVLSTSVSDNSATTIYQVNATFDELGRLLKTTGVGTSTWTNGYDKASNLVSEKDPRGGQQSFAFNGINELVKSADQNGYEVNNARDASGQIKQVTDPRGISTSYVRNGWGEVIQESSPDIGTVTYERNALGLITKKTDARAVVANYGYDAAGRLTAVTYPAAPVEAVSFTYDSVAGGSNGKGQLTGFSDPSGSTAIAYNSQGLVSKETVTVLGNVAPIFYNYDSAGNLFYMDYPSGRRVSYWRNAAGEINAVRMRKTSSAPLLDVATNIASLPFGGEAKSMVFGNGLNLWRTFDLNFRSNQISLNNGTSGLAINQYGYVDGMNLTRIRDGIDSTNDQSYWYTANGRLQNASGPWGDQNYYYDGVGNRSWNDIENGSTSDGDQYFYPSTNNRLSSISRNGATHKTYTYDAAGNTSTEVQGGVATSYTYNKADRLASFTKGGTQRGEYTYNARGQLVIRTVTNSTNNGTTVYFYDLEGHVIAEYDGATSALKREYVWLGDRPIAVIDAGTTDQVYYVHADHLNRPIAMTDASKAFVAKYSWLPFGGLGSYSGTKALDLRFPGQVFQAESGLHYNWFRQYDPSTGRYTQPDPMGLVDGPGRHTYANSDPLQQIDPNGLVSQSLPRTVAPGITRMTTPGVQVRVYDNFGNPLCDIDLNHDHGAGIPHFHFWSGLIRGPGVPMIGK